MDFKAIEAKWQQKWKDEKVFSVEVDSRPKYLITTPYPYTNGLLHMGHAFTYLTPEVRARFKRMQGHNVLFKWGFHCTGTPIVSAANRIKEGDEKQIQILKQMGISEEQISSFKEPEHWIEYFSKEGLDDLRLAGFSIDERYIFKTTPINPPYDAFIRWQFNKLKEKGYVKKGKHPVVWSKKESAPVGDHDRSEGEGETPQEFLLFKHQLADGRFVITATLRQDTVLGITNLFIHPDFEYIQAEVDGEQWILGENAFHALFEQGHSLKEISRIKGKDLLGLKTKEFDGSRVPILPATFINKEKGTGIVHSVPSDSADDLIALWDLQKNPSSYEKYGIRREDVESIKPIPVLDTPQYGDVPAEVLLKNNKVSSQQEREKLEKIKKELYKLSHYSATFNKKYETGFSENLFGKKVEQGKEIIKQDLIKSGFATPYYELTGRVVTRSGDVCVVKLVENQWFLEYNDPAWKKLAHACLDGMDIHPSVVRKQFDYVIDWLRNWACTRELGLGTKLPWDEHWVIESLSDSTLQMAYVTIAKYLQNPSEYGFSIEKLNDAFFSYVFLGAGSSEEVAKSTGINIELIERMRSEFNYWYPIDFRSSAKDLVQNHLTFCIFNHTAIFPEKHWPNTFSVNGRILINGEKMSKSKGNFKTMREEMQAHGTDIIRLTIANSGEGIDDANYDFAFLEAAKKKLGETALFYEDYYNKGREDVQHIDAWMLSMLNETIKKTTTALENVLTKSAIQFAFLDLTRHMQWYMRRTKNNPNKSVINQVIESQLLLLSPIIPHFCEELWQKIGKTTLIVNASWPKVDESKILADANQKEQLITSLLDDIRQVEKIAKISPSKVTVFTAPAWKYALFEKVKSLIDKEPKAIIGEIMQEFSSNGQEIMRFLPKMIQSRKLPEIIDSTEFEILTQAKEFLESELGASVEIFDAKDAQEPKAKQASPSKPAILLS